MPVSISVGVPAVPTLLGFSAWSVGAVLLAGLAAFDVYVLAAVVRAMTGAEPLPALDEALGPPTAPTAAGGGLSLPDGGPDAWH